MSTPTQAHRCVEFGIGSKKQPWILVCSCTVSVESPYGLGLQKCVDAFTDHVLAASRGSDEATDTLPGELQGDLVARFALCYVEGGGVVFDDRMAMAFARACREQNEERAADALAALTGKQ